MPKARTLPNYRRDYVTRLALCIAVQAISATERIRRPYSDQDDMKFLLDELLPSDVELGMLVENARYIIEGIGPSD